LAPNRGPVFPTVGCIRVRHGTTPLIAPPLLTVHEHYSYNIQYPFTKSPRSGPRLGYSIPSEIFISGGKERGGFPLPSRVRSRSSCASIQAQSRAGPPALVDRLSSFLNLIFRPCPCMMHWKLRGCTPARATRQRQVKQPRA
jgi:hypothetical protein